MVGNATPVAQKTTVSLGFLLPLFVVFLVLKLAGAITWSWWLVTLPLWIIPGIFLGIAAIGLGSAGLLIGGAKLLDKSGIPEFLRKRRMAKWNKDRLRLK